MTTWQGYLVKTSWGNEKDFAEEEKSYLRSEKQQELFRDGGEGGNWGRSGQRKHPVLRASEGARQLGS